MIGRLLAAKDFIFYVLSQQRFNLEILQVQCN